ncbi:MAG: hypothetical protein HQM08_07625 [Candidatus Riflebacteria bacterium]|nr:hypothetical protein [Candidatus Riflebacteria bacterium]
MNILKLSAIMLIIAGILGLVYGGFNTNQIITEARLGPIELSIRQKKTIEIPAWASVGAILVGGLLLL